MTRGAWIAIVGSVLLAGGCKFGRGKIPSSIDWADDTKEETVQLAPDERRTDLATYTFDRAALKRVIEYDKLHRESKRFCKVDIWLFIQNDSGDHLHAQKYLAGLTIRTRDGVAHGVRPWSSQRGAMKPGNRVRHAFSAELPYDAQLEKIELGGVYFSISTG